MILPTRPKHGRLFRVAFESLTVYDNIKRKIILRSYAGDAKLGTYDRDVLLLGTNLIITIQ